MCKKQWADKLNQAVFPGMQGGPLMHVIAAKAIIFNEAMQPAFKVYASQIVANARTVAHEIMGRGHRIISGGTDNHMMLVDVNHKGLSGKIAEKSLDAAGITINRNGIPYDTRKPLDPSGIRIGTPALTTRGMKELEMKRIAHWICDILESPDDKNLQSKIHGEIKELCKSFPAPSELA